MSDRTLDCGLCGKGFAPSGSCHPSCPMSSGCNLVRCPHCGYEFPDPEHSLLARFVRKLAGRR